MTISLPTPISGDQNELLHRTEPFRLHLQREANPQPFVGGDVTVGVENEFQVAVAGRSTEVDLPLTILGSRYYNNLTLRARRGDLSPHLLADLDAFLGAQQTQIWENSWVRFPRRLLSTYAASILHHDLLADKANPAGPRRRDIDSFLFSREGEPWLRVPVSYLLKLALADALGQADPAEPLLLQTGERLMDHLISDNCSPEVTSFFLASGAAATLPGRSTARETSRRFLILQLLIQYANQEFRLEHYGQQCHLYLAPNPPARQKALNELISDQFYRELFLNPCLSGWPRGEKKKEYMALCHRTLSRSQLNTIAKLKEAGIIVNNLVVLPNTSSTSLANNGTHITLGSRLLSGWYQRPEGAICEKYFGDLVIKIVEHFLPLFVTTCSAAPHRLSFRDFHPEKVMGYLPHELDYTHLRMLWRRWKKKAALRFCGHSFTPVGPQWLDRLTSTLLRLRGDFLPDVRLIDYLVALQSVEQSPALDGVMGNQERLKQDLTEMGVYDSRMAIYLPYRMRALAAFGFSGFEGRHYSLFPDLGPTFALAVDLQTLVTRLAYRWVLAGTVRHADIPDDPCTESERRQIFFATAIGVPTVFIRADSRNTLLRRILALADRQRPSRRYRGYLRIEVTAYHRACLALLRQECAMDGQEAVSLLDRVDAMLEGTEPTAAARLTGDILTTLGRETDPMRVGTQAFNRAAEAYYRTDLCHRHLHDGVETLIADGVRLEGCTDQAVGALKERLLGSVPAPLFIREAGHRVVNGSASAREIHLLILLALLTVHLEQQLGPVTA
jgi:hypothetical protein